MVIPIALLSVWKSKVSRVDNSTNSGISTMEKSGRVLLSRSELAHFYKTGQCPSSVSQKWGISDEELKSIIDNKCYEELP